MNWKEFLKPDWRKIVIFIILIFFLTFMIYDAVGFAVCSPILSETSLPLSIIKYPPWFRTLTWLNLFVNCLNNSYGKFTGLVFNQDILSYLLFGPLYIAGYPGSLVYWYLLSCLYVWVYDKLMKRKKK